MFGLALLQRRAVSKALGHAGSVGYGGKGLNIINTQAQLAWALAERAGCEIDQEAWEKSLNEIRLSTGDNGGVRYWTAKSDRVGLFVFPCETQGGVLFAQRPLHGR